MRRCLAADYAQNPKDRTVLGILYAVGVSWCHDSGDDDRLKRRSDKRHTAKPMDSDGSRFRNTRMLLLKV